MLSLDDVLAAKPRVERVARRTPLAASHTFSRMTGADDEAVALLSALRRDPDGGRWRRAATELDDE